MKIRIEEVKDYAAVEYLTREAFWNKMGPGCDEHYIIHKLREVEAFIPELSLVMEIDDRIIGHICYSKAKVIGEQGHKVVTMGPVSIHPHYQKKGLGELLIKHSFEKAKEVGIESVIIFGNPEYYKKYGFVNAKEFNIQTREGENFDAFMALEFIDGALERVEGRFFEDEVFETNELEVLAFEKRYIRIE